MDFKAYLLHFSKHVEMLLDLNFAMKCHLHCEMSALWCCKHYDAEDQLEIVATFGFFSACRAIGLRNSRSFIASIGFLKQIPKILHLFSRFQAFAIEILLKIYFNTL